MILFSYLENYDTNGCTDLTSVRDKKITVRMGTRMTQILRIYTDFF
ncbi:MAG: hypothetical protein RLZZ628_1051 [Bacteroidota bacterium]|jgi:hypothetical protein